MYRASDVIRVCNIVHAETGGMRNLRLMIEYGEDQEHCRHGMMAKYFEWVLCSVFMIYYSYCLFSISSS